MNTSDAFGPLAMAYATAKEFDRLEPAKLLGWNVPPEYSDLVHPHWRNFQEPETTWHALMAIMYFALMCVSLVGNGVVLYVFGVSKAIRTPSNLFVVNQALFDLFMMIEMPLLILNSMYRRPIGWQAGCDAYAFLGAVSGIGSAINNAAIAYDRYRTIAFPLDGRLGFKQAVGIVLGTWIWAMPFSILPIFRMWGARYVPEGFLTTCSFDYLTDSHETRMFVMSIFFWSYAFPLMLISLFYYLLFGHVRQHEKMLAEQAKRMNVKSLQGNTDAQQQSVEIRIAKVAFTIFFLFLCSWTPYATVAMIGAFGNRQLLSPMVTVIPGLAAKVVSCIDPWIYAINHPRYRKELQERIPWLIPRDPQSDTSSVVSEKTVASVDTPTA